MGQYMNPEKAVELGRSLVGVLRKYPDLSMALQGNEILVAVVDKGIFKAAPHIDCQEEFDYHYTGYRNGFTLNVDFYAIPRPVFEEFKN